MSDDAQGPTGDERRWRDRTRDVALAVVVLVVGLLGAPPATVEGVLPRPELDLGVALPLLVGSVALLARRRRPVPVWAVTLLVVGVLAVTGEPGRGLPAAVVALYTVASRSPRRTGVLAAVVTALVGLAAALAGEVGVADPVTLAVLPWCGLAAALGDAVRVHRASLLDARERARVAEQTRDEEARRRVAEERLHLSRELHDVVGHHLAVINVQAGLAQRFAERDPGAAAQALGEVRAAAGEALQQTGRLVGLLRSDEVERDPVPHLEQLPGLVAAIRAGGVAVTWERRGVVATGDPVVDQHAFRIAQEALTNAVRYGDGRVELRTDLDDGRYLLQVRNDVATDPPPAGSGLGLVGMRERVALCGGEIEVEHADGRHAVRVVLPVRRDAGGGS